MTSDGDAACRGGRSYAQQGGSGLAWSESGGDPGQARCAARMGPGDGVLFLRELRVSGPRSTASEGAPWRCGARRPGHRQLDPQEGLRRIAAAGRVDVRDLEASLIRLWRLTIARSRLLRGPDAGHCPVIPVSRGGQDWALPKPATDRRDALRRAAAGDRPGLSDVGLDRGDIGELLWAAQGVTGWRPITGGSPAGALYPLTVHVRLPKACSGTSLLVHRLCVHVGSGPPVALGGAALSQEWVGARRRCSRSVRTSLLRSQVRRPGGAILCSWRPDTPAEPAAPGRRARTRRCSRRAFDDDAVHELLLLPRRHRPVYRFPSVGRARRPPGR